MRTSNVNYLAWFQMACLGKGHKSLKMAGQIYHMGYFASLIEGETNENEGFVELAQNSS